MPLSRGNAPGGVPSGTISPDERDRVLDAARVCCERWGISKVTVDDIATQAGISRATLYRLFPGGREVLFEAMRRRNIAEFFAELDSHLAGADSLEDLVVAIVTHATRQLRSNVHLQLMLASEPGAVASSLGVESMPIIITTAAAMFGPRLGRFLPAEEVHEMAEWLSRLVVSYFLAPSLHVDLGDPDAVVPFVRRFVLPAFHFSDLSASS